MRIADSEVMADSRGVDGVRYYVYKLTSDTGAAPCVHDGLLTLALCKPQIRAQARVGDLVFGFAGNELSRDNRLIYAARVSAVERQGRYYELERYARRGDCIYVRDGSGELVRRSDAAFHADRDHRERDVGLFPDYEKAQVLLSHEFRYFGSTAERPAIDLEPFPALRRVLCTNLRGHRRGDADTALKSELIALWSAVMSLPNLGIEPVFTSGGCAPPARSGAPALAGQGRSKSRGC